MKGIIGLFVFFIATISQAQDYNCLLIPDSLKKDANVVTRYEEYVVTIKSAAKYTVAEKHVYSILNPTADKYAYYSSGYDQFSSINHISGVLYNVMGKELRHSKKSDWKDYSAYDGFSLLSDNRYKENQFYSAEYPYTVAYEEEDEYSSTLWLPSWRPQPAPGMAVQYSKFTIIAPADYIVRFRPQNFSEPPVITQKGDAKIYSWEIRNLPAKKKEVASPPFSEIAPSILFAPSQFEAAGYKGSMANWEDYGKFFYQLLQGRDVLPDDVKRKVHQLTDHLAGNREKIDTLYSFLQQHTRYVSIQLGIGGWQPFEASYVAQNKYGDCKALSNYMVALLKEAGITGKYVEIYAGDSPPLFTEDFPHLQSNHVISCVPMGKDTVWLECTSKTVSPGYMGSFTGNRKAILIDETGGHVVNTPVYKMDDNVQLRTISATADEEGDVAATIQSKYTGLQQDFPHSLMYDASAEERQKYLNRRFNIPTYQVIKNEYKDYKGIVPSVDELLQIKLSSYASVTGKRMFINPNLFGGAAEKPEPDTTRKYDYLVRNAYRYIDSVDIVIPNGYIMESTPKEITLQTKFGKYTSSVKLAGNKLTYYRLMEQNSGRFAAAEYNELVNFYEQVYKSDRNRVVLVKAQ